MAGPRRSWRTRRDRVPDRETSAHSSRTLGVLEIATRWIDRFYVLVPDGTGRFGIATGGVYSCYEFRNPPGVRWTDAEWRQTLTRGTAPARPAWEVLAVH
jgi:hypothetical protein